MKHILLRANRLMILFKGCVLLLNLLEKGTKPRLVSYVIPTDCHLLILIPIHKDLV